MYQKSDDENKKIIEEQRAKITKLRNESFTLKGDVNKLKLKLEEE